MKKIFFAIALLVSGAIYAADPGVDDKVVQKFNDAFPKAEKVKWYEGETYYEVIFENEKVKCRMWYNMDGTVIRTLRYYLQDGLSPFILAKLQSKHAGKKIFGVTEISSQDGVIYHVILEDHKKWYHVAADAMGNITVYKKYTKA